MTSHLADKLQTVHARHADVGDEHVWHRSRQVIERFASGARRFYSGPGHLQHLSDKMARILLVIDDEDANTAEGRHTDGRWPARLGMDARGSIACRLHDHDR